MDPELKAYLDAISDNLRACMDTLNRSMLHTTDCVTAPVTACTDATELAISARVEAQASGLQVAVDLLQQHACREKGDGAEEASPADPLDLSALKACSMEGLNRDTTQSSSTPAPTTAPPSTEGTLNGQAFGGVASTPTTCSMGCHPDTNMCVTVVAAPACSISDQDTVFPSTVDPVVELLRGVVPKPISMSAVLQGSPSSASIVKESPEDIHSDSSGFITKVPLSCSTDYRPQHIVAAPVLIASPTEYSIDSNNIPTAVLPLARRDEERPLPWPSFKEIKGGQFVNDAIEKVSGLCNSDSSCAKVCAQNNGDDTRPLPWPSFMEGDDSETLNKAIMKQLQCCSLDSLRTEGYAAVEMKNSGLCIVVRNFELKLMSIAPIPEAFVSCAKRCTFYLAGYFLTSGLMQDSAAYSIGQLFLSDPLASSIQAKFLGQAQEPSGTLLYILKLAEVKLTGRFREIENWWNYVLRTWLSWRLEIVIAFGTIVYTCTSLSRAYQFTCDPSDGSCSCVQISVYLHITISLVGIGSLDWVAHQAGFSFAQLQWVSVALMHSCGLIRLEKLCPNWRSAHSASGRPALLIPSQSVALKNIELWCLAWSNLDNHAEQWDSALDCLFNAIKQFSSGPGLHLQQLSNLWGAYQIWLVAWSLDVSEFFTSCGQAPFQGGRDVIHELSGAKQGSDLHELSLALLSVWQHAKYTQWSWDPGGCTFALYSSGKTVTTTLHSYEQFQGSSLCRAYAFQTWLVAWIVDGLESSTYCGQAPSQGGRNILQAEFSDQVNVCNYYLGFDCECADNCYVLDFSLDWISILRNCYFYLAEVYSNFYYHCDFDNVQELRVQWDPGGVAAACGRGAFAVMEDQGLLDPRLSHQAGSWGRRLGVKPSFKEGGMLGALLTCTHMGRLLLGPAHGPDRCRYKYQEEETRTLSKLDQANPAAASSLPTSALSFLSQFMLFILYPKCYTKTLYCNESATAVP